MLRHNCHRIQTKKKKKRTLWLDGAGNNASKNMLVKKKITLWLDGAAIVLRQSCH